MDKNKQKAEQRRIERDAMRKAQNKARLAYIAKRVNDPAVVSSYLAAKGWN